MKVKELMTKDPACCTPDASLDQVAGLMTEYNVGSIPIVDSSDCKKIVGLITDRDIITRTVAKGKNPLEFKAREIMSTSVVTAKEDDDVRDVTRLMEDRMIRRVPVVDDDGCVRGMVAQADIALKTSDKTTADVVQSISQPSQRSERRY
jgi:CBS domain-containing protein